MAGLDSLDFRCIFFVLKPPKAFSCGFLLLCGKADVDKAGGWNLRLNGKGGQGGFGFGFNPNPNPPARV